MGKKLIIGMGKSGLSCGRKLMEQGNPLLVYDKNAGKMRQEKDWKALTEFGPVHFIDDQWDEEDLKNLEEAVISPGISREIPLVKALEAKGISVVGEVELAFRWIHGTIVGITGTNGKTTTTTLLYEICRAGRSGVHLAGDIGYPLMELVGVAQDEDLIVVELSSFQLESIKDFRVQLGMVLNITPDHLDRHGSMEAYGKAKMNLFRNARPDDYALLNKDDALVLSLGKELKNRILFFSVLEAVDNGAFLEEGQIILSKDGVRLPLMPVEGIKIPGIHNVQNVLAAAAAAYFLGIEPVVIRETIEGFQGVEHRIEFVRTRNGVSYYNDSKGTNTDAGIIALRSMDRPVVLIAGGYDKKADYQEWIQNFFGKVRKVFLIGETAQTIQNQGQDLGFGSMEICHSLEEAVQRSAAYAEDGDVVLLSPGCASWDMFDNYEVRGLQFKELVMKL